jgi:hypothetical protein
MTPTINSPDKKKKKTVPPLIINNNRIAQECNRTQNDSNDSVFDENGKNEQKFNIVNIIYNMSHKSDITLNISMGNQYI